MAEWARANAPTHAQVEAGSVTHFPLWELMHIFGPKMHNGADAMFDSNSIALFCKFEAFETRGHRIIRVDE